MAGVFLSDVQAGGVGWTRCLAGSSVITMLQFIARCFLPGLALAALAACSTATGNDAELAPMPTELDPIIQAMIDDAATRTGVDRDAIQVESTEAITWSDGSLGCPQPGAMYTMALVPGYRVWLRADSARLDYHASARGYFVLCPTNRAQDPVGHRESR